MVRTPNTKRSKWASRLSFVKAIIQEIRKPSPIKNDTPVYALHSSHLHWSQIAKTDVVAVDNPYHPDYLVFRHSRGTFIELLRRGLRSAVRLLFSHKKNARQWQDAFGRLTSDEFWTRYLREDAVVKEIPCNRSKAA